MKACIAVALLALLPAPLLAQQPLRASDVLSTITSEGPAKAIDRYFHADSAFGDVVLNGIATGDSSWLRVAGLLRPASDGGVSESLTIAVAEALPRAPSRVLRMFGPDFTPERICGLPFIEQPAPDEAAYYRQVIAALGGVQSQSLRARRDECRVIVERAHAHTAHPASPAR